MKKDRRATKTESVARSIRKKVLEMVYGTHASHVGSNLSLADILAVLYTKVANISRKNLKSPDRDRIIISKGHAAAVVYAVLAHCNIIRKGSLDDYCKNKSFLMGHMNHLVPGVELSTGSLGHGLAVGAGLALAGKRDRRSYKVYVALSDGELDEGSNWETILFAPQHALDNLVAIVDYNKIQSFGRVKEVLDLEPIVEKWKSFRWGVRRIDGHDHKQIEKALKEAPFVKSRPSVIIADTVKGKGVSYMEDKLEWHYKTPNKEQFARAMYELDNK